MSPRSKTAVHQAITPNKIRLSRMFSLVSVVGTFILLQACTRGSVPIGATPIKPTNANEVQEAVTPISVESIYHPSGEYSVVWVDQDEKLRLRVPAGIAGTIVDELAYDSQGVHVTGNTTSLGSSLWVEIRGPDGEIGWVNSWNLSETVPLEAFCADPRVLHTLERASLALLNEDAGELSQVVNPRRGLIVRHDWWNPEVVVRPSEIQNLYLSQAERNWGVLRGGDFAITGSFSDVFSPLILDVLAHTPTAICGEIPGGVTSIPIEWPGEYDNIHFYAIHRSSPEGGNRFDWRTMVFGFEFIQGQPYLTLLVHFHGDI